MPKQPPQTRTEQGSSKDPSSGLLDNRFLSVLGHELRNPIAAIAMAAEALSRLCAGAPDTKAMADVIDRQARLATRLLDNLLDVARLASGRIELRPEQIDLVALIESAAPNWRLPFDAKGVQLCIEMPKSPLWILADAVRLKQAFGCLIDNALKFTAAGGQVVIAAGLSDPSTHACVEVRDTGSGLNPNDVTTIFAPFRPSGGAGQSQRGGLGLGLTLAKGLIELHGGSITAQSEGIGKGASFGVYLPLAKNPTERNVPTTSPSQRSLRILIIDDSPDVVTSLEFLLKHAGHELSAAPDGTRGIEAARSLAPDVILCDIGLPDIDGYAVARALRADPTTAGIYLIAVSGYGSDEDQRRSREAGFDMHLNKPEGFVGLSERLASLPIGRN